MRTRSSFSAAESLCGPSWLGHGHCVPCVELTFWFYLHLRESALELGRDALVSLGI